MPFLVGYIHRGKPSYIIFFIAQRDEFLPRHASVAGIVKQDIIIQIGRFSCITTKSEHKLQKCCLTCVQFHCAKKSRATLEKSRKNANESLSLQTFRLEDRTMPTTTIIFKRSKKCQRGKYGQYISFIHIHEGYLSTLKPKNYKKAQ